MKDNESQTAIPTDLLVAAMAQAMKELLRESGVVAELLDTVRGLRDIQMLKEGLLTYEQGAKILQMNARTFEVQVGEGKWPKVTTPGNQARVPLQGMIEVLMRGLKPVTQEVKVPPKIGALLNPPDGRRKAA